VGRGIFEERHDSMVLVKDIELYSLCDNTNPNWALQEQALGYPTAGVYGYTHAFGGYAGSQSATARTRRSSIASLMGSGSGSDCSVARALASCGKRPRSMVEREIESSRPRSISKIR
jgi:hypothetical protein